MSFGGTLCELEGRGRAVGVGFDQFGLRHLNAGSEVERMEPFPTLVRTGLHGSQTDNTRDVLAGVSIRTTLIEDVLRMSALRETHHGSGEMVTGLHCLQHIADNGGSHSCAVRNAGILGGIHEMKHPMHEAINLRLAVVARGHVSLVQIALRIVHSRNTEQLLMMLCQPDPYP